MPDQCPSRRPPRPPLFIGACALGLALWSCGPGGPVTGDVEGTVTLNGEPLEGTLVLFTPVAGGRPAGARTDAEGHYELIYTEDQSGALLGEHNITISTYQEGEPSAGIPGVPEKVPPKYNTRSELKASVDEEGQEHDFALESTGSPRP